MSWECWARINKPYFLPEESLPLVSSIAEGPAAVSEWSSTQEGTNSTRVLCVKLVVIGTVLLLVLYWIVVVIREEGGDVMPWKK